MNEAVMEPLTEISSPADSFVMPASVGQKRFWMLEQMSPGSTALNIPVAFELRGPLEVDVLESALRGIVDRHESFRTHFELIDGEPRQVIAPQVELVLHRVTDDGPAADERAERVRRVMNREALCPVDFTRAPLFRVSLLELDAEDHVLMLTFHHIICDGWSTGLIVRELAAFYEARRREAPVQLPPLAIQYADYVVWQQDWITTPEFRQQLDFWRGLLEGETPPLDVPTDFVRRGGQSTAAVLETRLLPAAITESLKRICQEEGVTLFMIFLSAYAALLHRYTGQSRIIVGSTAANRDRAELEPIIGLFANLISIPADISGAMTFRELLATQCDRSLGAFANHEAPFELVVQELQQAGPAKVLMHTHLLFQRAFMQPSAAGDLHIRPLPSVSPGSTFELTFGIVERASEGIRLQMEYRTSLFRRGTITRFLLHFQQLLEAVAAQPETRIDELPLFADNEREEIEARLALALGGSGSATRNEVFADFDRQLESHWMEGKETFAPIMPPEYVALTAADARGNVAPLGLVGPMQIAMPGAATPDATPFVGRNVESGVELWGRAEDLIRINGHRFNRRAVEVHLRSHPHVGDAEVAPGPNGRLSAQVVAREGNEINVEGLREWMKTRVSDLLVPATIQVVRRLGESSNESTKADRATPVSVPLQALVQQQLLEIWQRLLRTQDLTIDSNFFESGGNSFLALRMITEAEKLAHQTLPLSLLLRGATVRELARHILEGANEKNLDVIPVQATGPCTPLFFLHGDWIGGGFYCNRLAQDLGADQPFYALPPFHMGEERIVTMRDMAAYHVAALRRERPHGPYIIGGYCIGAVVAIEVARMLLAEGETVEHLFLIDPPLWGGIFLAGMWPWIDRLGERHGWNLERKIAFFDRTAVAGGRWWRKPFREKFGAVLHRLGFDTTMPEERSGAVEDLGGAQILDGLDFSTYYLAYRLHDFSPLAVPATLLLPDCMSEKRQLEAPVLTRIDSAHLSVVLIPGNHTTCITQHTAGLAEKMLVTLKR